MRPRAAAQVEPRVELHAEREEFRAEPVAARWIGLNIAALGEALEDAENAVGGDAEGAGQFGDAVTTVVLRQVLDNVEHLLDGGHGVFVSAGWALGTHVKEAIRFY